MLITMFYGHFYGEYKRKKLKKSSRERKAWTIDQFKSPLWLIFDSSPLSMPHSSSSPPPHNTALLLDSKSIEHNSARSERVLNSKTSWNQLKVLIELPWKSCWFFTHPYARTHEEWKITFYYWNFMCISMRYISSSREEYYVNNELDGWRLSALSCYSSQFPC